MTYTLLPMGLFRRRTRPAAETATQVIPPNEAEQQWIADYLEVLQTTGTDVADPVALSALYDQLLAHWLATPPDLRPDPNPDINLLGIGLGEHLRRRNGVLNWAVVVAAEGPEIALHGQPGDIIIYPTNAVAKRWATHDMGFLRTYAEDMSAAVARITAAGTAPA
jgi:hypothetical protein